MDGPSPAMTVEAKFVNVFMAFSTGGNIRVIKFGFEGELSVEAATATPSAW